MAVVAICLFYYLKVTGVYELQKSSCDVGIYFGIFLGYSVKIANLKKSFGCLPENAGCIPSAVVIMTTADGMHPAFSGMYLKLILISDPYRSLPTSHGNCRSPLYPCYIKQKVVGVNSKADVREHCLQIIAMLSALLSFTEDKNILSDLAILCLI